MCKDLLLRDLKANEFTGADERVAEGVGRDEDGVRDNINGTSGPC